VVLEGSEPGQAEFVVLLGEQFRRLQVRPHGDVAFGSLLAGVHDQLAALPGCLEALLAFFSGHFLDGVEGLEEVVGEAVRSHDDA